MRGRERGKNDIYIYIYRERERERERVKKFVSYSVGIFECRRVRKTKDR